VLTLLRAARGPANSARPFSGRLASFFRVLALCSRPSPRCYSPRWSGAAPATSGRCWTATSQVLRACVGGALQEPLPTPPRSCLDSHGLAPVCHAEGAHAVLCREHRAYVPRKHIAEASTSSERMPSFLFRRFYVGFDRAGHPVYLEYFGATQWLKARIRALQGPPPPQPVTGNRGSLMPSPCQVLQHVPADEVVRAHIQQMEITSRLLYRAASARAGRPIQRQVNILDMRGLAVGSLTGKAMELTGKIAKVDQDHYPETLEACYIINPPWAFSAAFNLVTRFLDEKTRKKVQVLGSGPDLPAKLRAVLGPDAFIPAAAVTGPVDGAPVDGLLGAHDICYEYVAERERAIARGEAVDGARALASSRSYAALAALGSGGRGDAAAQPAAPSSPPPLPPRSTAHGSSPQPGAFASPSVWSTKGGGGSFRDDYGSDTDGPASVYLDAPEEEDERAGLVWGGPSSVAGPASSAGSAVSGSSHPPASWGTERDRTYSARLLHEQPESFRAAQQAEALRPPPSPRLFASSSQQAPRVSELNAYPRGRQLLPDGDGAGGDEEDDSDLREMPEKCCFCFYRRRR